MNDRQPLTRILRASALGAPEGGRLASKMQVCPERRGGRHLRSLLCSRPHGCIQVCTQLARALVSPSLHLAAAPFGGSLCPEVQEPPNRACALARKRQGAVQCWCQCHHQTRRVSHLCSNSCTSDASRLCVVATGSPQPLARKRPGAPTLGRSNTVSTQWPHKQTTGR